MFGAEKRQLKAENKMLEGSVEHWRSCYQTSAKTNEALVLEKGEMRQQIVDQAKELDELRGIKREQTEADLLLAAVRIQQKILNGGRPTAKETKHFNTLQDQYDGYPSSAYQQAAGMRAAAPAGGLWGALGGGAAAFPGAFR